MDRWWISIEDDQQNCIQQRQKKSDKSNVVGKEFSEAAGIIGGKDLKYSRPKSAKNDDEFIVVDQYPKAGTKVKKNSVVYVYKE